MIKKRLKKMNRKGKVIIIKNGSYDPIYIMY